jgi:steroid delta-isomerase-like uncharacterized protein
MADTSAQNKAVARRFFDEVFNKGQLQVVDEIFAKEYVGYSSASLKGPIKGPAGIKEFVTTYRTAFPDIHFAFEDVLTDGDKVSIRWTTTGTHKGSLPGVAATGKKMSVTGIGIAQILDAKIIRSFSQINTLSMLQQLGVIPSIPVFNVPGDVEHR